MKRNMEKRNWASGIHTFELAGESQERKQSNWSSNRMQPFQSSKFSRVIQESTAPNSDINGRRKFRGEGERKREVTSKCVCPERKQLSETMQSRGGRAWPVESNWKQALTGAVSITRPMLLPPYFIVWLTLSFPYPESRLRSQNKKKQMRRRGLWWATSFHCNWLAFFSDKNVQKYNFSFLFYYKKSS